MSYQTVENNPEDLIINNMNLKKEGEKGYLWDKKSIHLLNAISHVINELDKKNYIKKSVISYKDILPIDILLSISHQKYREGSEIKLDNDVVDLKKIELSEEAVKSIQNYFAHELPNGQFIGTKNVPLDFYQSHGFISMRITEAVGKII